MERRRQLHDNVVWICNQILQRKKALHIFVGML